MLISTLFISGNVNANEGQGALTQTVQTALEYNPEIKSFLITIDIADENIDLARSGYRPGIVAEASINHTQQDTNLLPEWESGTEKNITLSLIQSLYTGGQVSAEIDKEKDNRDVTQAEYKALVNDIILQAVQAYMDIYQASESITVKLWRLGSRQESSQKQMYLNLRQVCHRHKPFWCSHKRTCTLRHQI